MTAGIIPLRRNWRASCDPRPWRGCATSATDSAMTDSPLLQAKIKANSTPCDGCSGLVAPFGEVIISTQGRRIKGQGKRKKEKQRVRACLRFAPPRCGTERETQAGCCVRGSDKPSSGYAAAALVGSVDAACGLTDKADHFRNRIDVTQLAFEVVQG